MDIPKSANPLAAAKAQAVEKLAAMVPTFIIGTPDMIDAKWLIMDLKSLCDLIDPLIAAYGQYAESNFGKIDQSLFTDQLRGALEGNAMFEIERAARAMLEDMS